MSGDPAGEGAPPPRPVPAPPAPSALPALPALPAPSAPPAPPAPPAPDPPSAAARSQDAAATIQPPADDSLAPASPPGAPASAPTLVAPGSPAAPRTAEPGRRRFGRYELVQELGRGGMGVVYKAWHPELKTHFALKVLLAGASASADEVARFRREAEAAARLSHPGIVAVHDIGTAEGKTYFAMEYVEGLSLDKVLADPAAAGLDEVPGFRFQVPGAAAGRRAGALAPDTAAAMIQEVATALQVAHDAGVLHRDLKPANILRAKSGVLKIMDFGLAKLLDAQETGATRSGTVLGTPAYMSPEQAEGRIRDLTVRSDVYQLGAILFELLTGRPPYVGATTMGILLAVLHEDPPPPRTLNPRIDRDLDTIVMKCLQRDPTRRYKSAGEVAEDCRRWRAGEPIVARAAGPVERAWKLARRRRAVVVPGAVAAVLLLAVAAWFGIGAVLDRVRLARLRGAAEDAVAAQDFDAAERHARAAQELAPNDKRSADVLARVRAEKAYRDGLRCLDQYHAAQAAADAADADHRQAQKRLENERTHAKRSELWRAADAAVDAARRREEAFAEAVAAFTGALGHWREHTGARDRLADVYWERYRAAEGTHNRLDMATYRALVLRYAPGRYEPLLRGEGEVVVRFLLPARPAGAAPPPSISAFLYRYERNAVPPVLVPVPFDPAKRELAGAPADALAPAEPVRLAALDRAAAGSVPPEAQAARRGSVYRLAPSDANRLRLPVAAAGSAWPGPAAAPAAAPATGTPATGTPATGTAATGTPATGTPATGTATAAAAAPPEGAAGRPWLVFRQILPRGSYLLHFPAGQGVYETRYPFEVTRDRAWDEVCELPPENEVPPLPPGAEGDARAFWIYVPAGPYHASGDRDAIQSPARPAAVIRLPEGRPVAEVERPRATGFFSARFEVTSAMYLAYLNDRSYQSEDRAFARVPRQAPDVTEKAARWHRDGAGGFRIDYPGWRADWPVISIAWDDAVDYAQWLSGHSGDRDWQVALPSEDEWEQAARGPDGRSFPWGDDFDPTFCSMAAARAGEQKWLNVEPYGLFPLDESVYGPRDAAGGVQEWTATRADVGVACLPVVKGGAWGGQAGLCRCSSRLALELGHVFTGVGFRLSARRRLDRDNNEGGK